MTRVYYDRNGRRSGHSMSGGEAYMAEVWGTAGTIIVGVVVVAAVLAVSALILAFVLICGLLWCIGWLMSRTGVGAERGRRLQAGIKTMFTSSTGQASKRRAKRASARGVANYFVTCPHCAATLTLPEGRNIKCPKCNGLIDVAKTTIPDKPRPTDPWLNEIAVALADFGLTECGRYTGSNLGGAPLKADIALEGEKFLVYINLFSSDELAHQAEIGLRAKPEIREAVSQGLSMVKTVGRLVYVANGRGAVVDEFRLADVIHVVGETLSQPLSPQPHKPQSEAAAPRVGPAASPPRSHRSPSSQPAGAMGSQDFNGNGSKKLGTIVIPVASTVAWTDDGGFFSVFDDEDGFGIRSEGQADESFIDAGTYHHVSVKAAGNWTMSINPITQ